MKMKKVRDKVESRRNATTFINIGVILSGNSNNKNIVEFDNKSLVPN